MDNDLDTIEEAFEFIPEEVQEYVFGRKFVALFNTFCIEKGLTPDEKTLFKGTLYGYLAQIDTEEKLVAAIQKISKTPQTNQEVMNWVRTMVIEPVLALATNAYLDQEEEDKEDELQLTAPVVATVTPPKQNPLVGLQARLTQSNMILPVKRDLSPDSTPAKPVIDPYREAPDK